MSRPGPPDPADPVDPDGPGPGSARPTSPGPLVVVGAAGAVLGWTVRPLSFRLAFAEPVVTWWSVAVIWAIGACVAILALRTWRALQRPSGPVRTGPGLEAYQAVNRLVLGKAAALAGALVLGVYAGLVISRLGVTPTELSTQRLVRSAVAALGGAWVLGAGLLLERACRVRDDAA